MRRLIDRVETRFVATCIARRDIVNEGGVIEVLTLVFLTRCGSPPKPPTFSPASSEAHHLVRLAATCGAARSLGISVFRSYYIVPLLPGRLPLVLSPPGCRAFLVASYVLEILPSAVHFCASLC